MQIQEHGDDQARLLPLVAAMRHDVAALLRVAEIAATPRLLVTREEAARSLGMSLDSFERHVQHEVAVVRRGRLRLVPVKELERWIKVNAQRIG